MSRTEFVGNKDEEYAATLPATTQYPELTIAEFQSVFHFLSNETEMGILHHAKLARITVHSELLETMKRFDNLDHLSVTLFGDEEAAAVLYTQAVFALTANYLIGNKLSTDATAEAADRQEALQQKADNALLQYRRAIDFLLNAKATYTFAVV